MDRSRATAIAVRDFAASEGTIETSAGGRLRLRVDRPGGTRKSVTFWLHFVDMPVQIGAATSPQSMMQPPEARVE
jgi:hypothetical protein